MAWTVEYDDDLQIVVLTYLGNVTGAEIKEAAVARIGMGKQKGATKFLIDTRTVEADKSATMSIYDLPTKVYPEKHAQHTSRIAIVGPQSSASKEMVKFFENACVNRGWSVMTFENRESAVKWLQQMTSQQPPERDK